MMKRLMNFLLFSTGITPKDHKEPDKWAKFRAEREAWERAQREREDAAHAAATDALPLQDADRDTDSTQSAT